MAKATPASVPTASDCAKMGMSCACSNLRRASRAMTQLFDTYFDEVGLKATQFTVLAALTWAAEADASRPQTINGLADTLVLEQSSLSRNLAVLERLGLVRVALSDRDRRERVVTVTRAGRTALARGTPIWRKAQAAVASAIGTGELEDQLRALRRLTKTAQQLRPKRQRGSSVRPPPAN